MKRPRGFLVTVHALRIISKYSVCWSLTNRIICQVIYCKQRYFTVSNKGSVGPWVGISRRHLQELPVTARLKDYRHFQLPNTHGKNVERVAERLTPIYNSSLAVRWLGARRARLLWMPYSMLKTKKIEKKLKRELHTEAVSNLARRHGRRARLAPSHRTTREELQIGGCRSATRSTFFPCIFGSWKCF